MVNEEISQEDGPGVDRRNLLKGAVAAGVGVVAWSSPSISSIGGTPAYAAVCTGVPQEWFLGYRNTSCDCWDETGSVKYVAYKPLSTQQCQATPNAPRQVTFSFDGDNSGQCPPDAFSDNQGQVAGLATATIPAYTGTGPEYCAVRVDVVLDNCSTTEEPLATAFSDAAGDEPLVVGMPLVNCGQGVIPANSFLRVYLVCADDEACLYT